VFEQEVLMAPTERARVELEALGVDLPNLDKEIRLICRGDADTAVFDLHADSLIAFGSGPDRDPAALMAELDGVRQSVGQRLLESGPVEHDDLDARLQFGADRDGLSSRCRSQHIDDFLHDFGQID
jgi:hypothetical protein